MPSGCVSGRQALSKSVNVPGLIRRVVIQVKYSSIAASSRTVAGVATGTAVGGGPFPRLLLVRGTPRLVDPAATSGYAPYLHRPATTRERAHGGVSERV